MIWILRFKVSDFEWGEYMRLEWVCGARGTSCKTIIILDHAVMPTASPNTWLIKTNTPAKRQVNTKITLFKIAVA